MSEYKKNSKYGYVKRKMQKVFDKFAFELKI